MRNKKGDIQVFSISFLDVLSCALGAVIILLVVVPKSPASSEQKTNLITILKSKYQSMTKDNNALNNKAKQLQSKNTELENEVKKLAEELQKVKKKPTPKPVKQPKKSPKPSLFGLPLKAGHAVFVIDVSVSMDWQIKNLYNTVESLLLACEVDKFRFIYFDENVYSSGQYWNYGWVDGSADNKERILKECGYSLNQLVNNKPYGTNTGDALGEALRFKETDVVYFITDGSPTAGDTSIERILLRVRRMNTQSAIINSIMVGLPGAYSTYGGQVVFDPNAKPKILYDFLHDIASQNGGVYIGR